MIRIVRSGVESPLFLIDTDVTEPTEDELVKYFTDIFGHTLFDNDKSFNSSQAENVIAIL